MHNNEEIVGKIKELMEHRKISLSELSRKADVAKSSMSRYMNLISPFPLNKIDEVASALNVSSATLLGLDVHPSSSLSTLDRIYENLNEKRKRNVLVYATNQLEEQTSSVNEKTVVYVYGSVSAGTGEYLQEEYREPIPYSGTVPAHDFAVRVNGDSMEPVLQNGEIIFINQVTEARSGQIVIVSLNGDAYVKKFYKEDGKVRLISLNPKYSDIVLSENDELKLFGVVVL